LTRPRVLLSLPSVARAEAVEEVTALLREWRIDVRARGQVFELLYDDLKRRAARHLRRERPGHTLSPTALVHEGYLRLAAQQGPWRNREQFLAVASRMMRRVLVDYARARRAEKRAPPLCVAAEALGARASGALDLLGLDEALDALAREDPRSARLVELKFFGGLTLEEAAAALSVSKATTERDWSFAKTWLFHRLKQAAPEPR